MTYDQPTIPLLNSRSKTLIWTICNHIPHAVVNCDCAISISHFVVTTRNQNIWINLKNKTASIVQLQLCVRGFIKYLQMQSIIREILFAALFLTAFVAVTHAEKHEKVKHLESGHRNDFVLNLAKRWRFLRSCMCRGKWSGCWRSQRRAGPGNAGARRSIGRIRSKIFEIQLVKIFTKNFLSFSSVLSDVTWLRRVFLISKENLLNNSWSMF